MRVIPVVITLILTCSMVSGCGKKEKVDESQELLSLEELSTMNVSESVSITDDPSLQPLEAAKMEPLPPSGPYKPSNQEIQIALKNAGYYAGAIDGKIGPMSREAIEDFQRDNGLVVDGKVGPKTWTALEKFLNKRR